MKRPAVGPGSINRRNFLKTGAAAAVATGVAHPALAARTPALAAVDGYRPAAGELAAVPRSNRTLDPADSMPPADFESWRVPGMIYPYLNATALAKPRGKYPAPEGAYDTAARPMPAAGGAPGGNPDLWVPAYEVSVNVTNVGDRVGEEVVQLYLETGLKDDPVQVLRGFEKVELAPGETKEVRIVLTRRDVMRWDVVRQDWTYPEASRRVWVGGCSRGEDRLVADLN